MVSPSAEPSVASITDERRIRRALKQAQDVLWEWLPPTGGPSDFETVSRLRLVFADKQLQRAIRDSNGRVASAARDILAVLARKRVRKRSSRLIIDALWSETAIDRPWLNKVPGVKPEERMTFTYHRAPESGNGKA
jgi:hypothetical protein